MTESTSQPALSDLSAWEKWVNSFFVWVPYAALIVSVAIAMVVLDETPDRLLAGGLVAVAAVWTWLTFTRAGAPTRVPQDRLRLYFLGFIVIAALLMFQNTVFLVYGITGFFHAALLRPWLLAFAGIGITGLLVHSHIVITESKASTWAIYLGVVAAQTGAVAFGLYAGQRMTEIAEERRQALQRLELAMDENAGLHAQLVSQAREAGVLDERQRMAREIHDTIAQGLTGVITQIEAAHQSWDDESEVKRRLHNASDLARDSLAEARRSVQAIRPAPLEDSRLPDALADIASRWSEVTGVPVQVQTTGTRSPLRPEVEVTLLRVAQEGLANVEKHAAATRAAVTLSFMDGLVSLDIRDDGIGFDTAKPARGQSFGLSAMRQRVESMHGALQIESEHGEGTAVSVQIPTATTGSTHV